MKKVMTALLVVLLIWACVDSTGDNSSLSVNESGNVINPNGDSELALWMRGMFDEMMLRKKAIAQGSVNISIPLDDALKHAQATEPEKAASPEYQQMADTYLNMVESFNQAQPIQKKEAFNGVVGQCMSCHQLLCPGPTVRIKKLYIK